MMQYCKKISLLATTGIILSLLFQKVSAQSNATHQTASNSVSLTTELQAFNNIAALPVYK